MPGVALRLVIRREGVGPAECEVRGRALDDPVAGLRGHPSAGGLDRDRAIVLPEGDMHWVRPEVVVEVTYLTWTEDNLLRQVSYQGQREDKPARHVVRRRVARSGD